MNFLECEWSAALEFNELWHRLTPDQRAKMLKFPPAPPIKHIYGKPEPSVLMSPAAQALLMDALQLDCAIPATSSGLEFFKQLKLLADPSLSEAASADWVEKFLHNSYVVRKSYFYLAGHWQPVFNIDHLRCGRRLASFLKLKSPQEAAQWFKKDATRCVNPDTSPSRDKPLSTQQRFDAAILILRQLQRASGPLSLTECFEQAKREHKDNSSKSISSDQWMVATYTLMMYGMFFLRLNPDTLALEIMPTALPEQPIPIPTSKPEPATLSSGFLVPDMTALLKALVAKPLRVKTSATIDFYAKDCRDLASNSVEVEASLISVENRGSRSLTLTRALEFTLLADHEVQLTTAGREWLGKGENERLQQIIEQMKFGTKLTFSPPQNIYAQPTDFRVMPANLDDGFRAAFRHLPDEYFVDASEWINWAARHHSPIVHRLGESGSYTRAVENEYNSVRPRLRWVEDSEEDARQAIHAFLFTRLIPLGVVDYFADKQRATTIRLNALGKFFLGMTSDFHPAEASSIGRVVVQPNFDIVFLGKNDLAEATIATLFSKPKPKAGESKEGIPFKITKADCLAAANKGFSYVKMESVLKRITGQPLPKNVSSEMQGWFDSKRTFNYRPAMLLETPDNTTTEMILTQLAGKVIKISPTQLLVDSHRHLTGPELTKLQKLGIFPDRS